MKVTVSYETMIEAMNVAELGQSATKELELHRRQTAYIDALGRGLNRRQAAIEAGYSVRASRVPLKKIETDTLRARMQHSLKRQGATFDKMARTVVDAMNAEKAEEQPGEDGKPRLVMVKDHRTAVQATKVATEMWGMGERQSSTTHANIINITIPESMAGRYQHVFTSDSETVIEGE